MDDYMASIINGGKEDGKITYLGYKFNFKYHAQCLIDYASKKYPNISGFSKLDYMKEPNSPIYYLTLLGNIVFTNISLTTITTGIIASISFKDVNTIKTEFTKILSAIASNILPVLVISPFFLAIYPSRKSVRLAIINKIPDIIYLKFKSTSTIVTSGKSIPIS